MPVEQSGLVLANPNLDLRAYAALFDATPKETTNQSFLDRVWQALEIFLDAYLMKL